MTKNDAYDFEYETQCQALADTIAWDDIYARATAQARASGFAQLILETGTAEYGLIDGRDPNALSIERLGHAKIHVILDWS